MSQGSKTISLFLWILFCLLQSCDRPEINPEGGGSEPPPPGVDTTKVPVKPEFYDENTWIYGQMTVNYLWADEMPDEDSTDKSLEPLEYFNSLIRAEKDRYSYGKETYAEIGDYWNGNLESYGFRYKQLADSSAYHMVVSLVLKGSPAEEAGLKRGDRIVRMDGEKLSSENTEELLDRNTAVFEVVTPEDSVVRLTLTKRKFQIDPLQFYSIIEWGGKKVGYLVYTQFLFNYEEETRKVFDYFKQNGIDEMVMDLRFNPGGVTPNAEVIASLLGPDVGSGTELFHALSNRYQQENNSGEDNRRYFTRETANLSGLSRVFVLTSKSSASSSELVINCLRPYRPVITVGGNTYGKNVISTIISDDSGRYAFTLMPAWSAIFNVNNESSYGNTTGIPADYPVEENVLPYRALGDPSETLLAKALEVIGGEVTEEKGAKIRQVQMLNGYHHFDTGSGFLGNKRFNP